MIIADMIARIRGFIVEVKNNEVVVMTSGGVGYRLTVPRGAVPPDSALPTRTGQPPEVFLRVHHRHVERQGDTLFGFSTEAQERLFHLLMSTPGIGGASAIKIMSEVGVTRFLLFVSMGDIAHLRQMKGVGKKTAENIVHACQDKARDLVTALGLTSPGADHWAGNMLDDVAEALVTSGFARDEAERVARSLPQTAESTLASLLGEALRELDGG